MTNSFQPFWPQVKSPNSLGHTVLIHHVLCKQIPASESDSETETGDETELSGGAGAGHATSSVQNIGSNPAAALRSACLRLMRLLAVAVGSSGVQGQASGGPGVQSEARLNLSSLMRSIVQKGSVAAQKCEAVAANYALNGLGKYSSMPRKMY